MFARFFALMRLTIFSFFAQDSRRKNAATSNKDDQDASNNQQFALTFFASGRRRTSLPLTPFSAFRGINRQTSAYVILNHDSPILYIVAKHSFKTNLLSDD